LIVFHLTSFFQCFQTSYLHLQFPLLVSPKILMPIIPSFFLSVVSYYFTPMPVQSICRMCQKT
jgi:hypothetical protein